MSWRTAYTALVLRFAETLIVAISNTPMLRLLEADVCRNYYRVYDPSVIAIDDSIPESLCKIAGVQQLVADVNGPTYVFNLIPALLAAIPYVFSSETSNKKRTLLVNVVGSVLGKLYYLAILYLYNTFDPRWIWLDGIFSFIGGGDIVFYSLVQSLVAESVPSQSLSNFYLYSTAIALSVKVASTAAGLSLMNISIWIPISISLAIKLLDIPVILSLTACSNDESEVRTPVGFHLVPEDEEAATLKDADGPTTKDMIALGWRSLLDRDSVIYIHVFALGIITLQESSNSMRLILPYWLSRRWHTTLQEVGYVNVGEMLLTAAVVSSLPKLSRILEHPADVEGSSKKRDLVLAKTCLCFTAIGVTLLGFSWYKISGIVSLIVLSGGHGFQDAYLSFITAELLKEEIARFYMIASMVALAAVSVGGTVISGVYSLCLTYGESWLTSLPIWLCVLPIIGALLMLNRIQI